MNTIFRLYFRKNLAGTADGAALCLAITPVLAFFDVFLDRDIALLFWGIVVIPGGAMILGALTGADSVSPESLAAESHLPVSPFARLSGAFLSALLPIVAAAVLLLVISNFIKDGRPFFRGGLDLPSAAYVFSIAQACGISFAFGAISRSMAAGAAAGAALTLLTISGTAASVVIDIVLLADGATASFKMLIPAMAAICAALSLRNAGEIIERRPASRTRSLFIAIACLAAGPLASTLALTHSVRAGNRLLSAAGPGDRAMLNFIYAEDNSNPGYHLFENPVKGEFVLAAPDGKIRTLMRGTPKGVADFLRDPVNFMTAASLVMPDGEVWLITRGREYRLYHARPGDTLKVSGSLGVEGKPDLAMFRIGKTPYIVMRDGKGLYSIAEPGTNGIKGWRSAGDGHEQAREYIIALKKRTGAYAWLSKTGTTLLAMSDSGRQRTICELPHKGAAFFHSPLYEGLTTDGRESFFLPLLDGERAALYYCGPGTPASPAWDSPQGYMFEFQTNPDGSAFTTVSRRDEDDYKDIKFYIVDNSGRMRLPVDAKKVFAQWKYRRARPVKASEEELIFLLDESKLIKLDSAGARHLSSIPSKRDAAKVVREGIIYRDRGGLRLVDWTGRHTDLRISGI